MLLGFAAFAERPFSTVGEDNSVTISATANALAISIGNPGITADAVTEIPTGSQITLGLGTVTLSTSSTISLTANPLTLGTGNVTVSGSALISPSGNGVVISSGTVTITASATVTPAATPLTLSTGTVAAITWSEIQPGATMTWVPIVPI